MSYTDGMELILGLPCPIYHRNHRHHTEAGSPEKDTVPCRQKERRCIFHSQLECNATCIFIAIISDLTNMKTEPNKKLRTGMPHFCKRWVDSICCTFYVFAILFLYSKPTWIWQVSCCFTVEKFSRFSFYYFELCWIYQSILIWTCITF